MKRRVKGRISDLLTVAPTISSVSIRPWGNTAAARASASRIPGEVLDRGESIGTGLTRGLARNESMNALAR
jgi:hypothetical protein